MAAKAVLKNSYAGWRVVSLFGGIAQLAFTASAQGKISPDLSLVLDPDPKGDGYLFRVVGFTLDAGMTVTVTLDLEVGLLHFTDDYGDEDRYVGAKGAKMAGNLLGGANFVNDKELSILLCVADALIRNGKQLIINCFPFLIA